MLRKVFNNKGSAIVPALVGILALSMLGFAMMQYSYFDTAKVVREEREKQAYYMARSGLRIMEEYIKSNIHNPEALDQALGLNEASGYQSEWSDLVYFNDVADIPGMNNKIGFQVKVEKRLYEDREDEYIIYSKGMAGPVGRSLDDDESSVVVVVEIDTEGDGIIIPGSNDSGPQNPGHDDGPGGGEDPSSGGGPGDNQNPGDNGDNNNPGSGNNPGDNDNPGSGDNPGGNDDPGNGDDNPGGNDNPGSGGNGSGDDDDNNPGSGNNNNGPGGNDDPGNGDKDNPSDGDDNGSGNNDKEPGNGNNDRPETGDDIDDGNEPGKGSDNPGGGDDGSGNDDEHSPGDNNPGSGSGDDKEPGNNDNPGDQKPGGNSGGNDDPGNGPGNKGSQNDNGKQNNSSTDQGKAGSTNQTHGPAKPKNYGPRAAIVYSSKPQEEMPDLYYQGLLEESLPTSFFGSDAEDESGSLGGSKSKIKFGSWYNGDSMTYEDIDEELFSDIEFEGQIKFTDNWDTELDEFDEFEEIEEDKMN